MHCGTARRKALVVVAGFGLCAEAIVVARRRGSLIGVNTVVRCRDGHLSTTLWIPGASLKALRLGWWRFSAVQSEGTGASSPQCAQPS